MAPMPFFGMMPGPGQMVMQQPPPRPSPSPSSVDDGGDADSVTAAMAMLTPKSGPKAKVRTPRSKSLPSKAPHLDAPEPEAAKPKTEGLEEAAPSPAVAEKAEHAPAPEVPEGPEARVFSRADCSRSVWAGGCTEFWARSTTWTGGDCLSHTSRGASDGVHRCPAHGSLAGLFVSDGTG